MELTYTRTVRVDWVDDDYHYQENIRLGEYRASVSYVRLPIVWHAFCLDEVIGKGECSNSAIAKAAAEAAIRHHAEKQES